MKHTAVFDTNVLFSATAWRGKPFQCVQLARDGQVEGVTCTEILAELSEKLILRLNFTPEQVVAILGSLLTFLRPVTITGTLTGGCRDPKDDMVLECAVLAGASHIVSGDKRHLLSLNQFRGIPIVSPAEFVRLHQP